MGIAVDKVCKSFKHKQALNDVSLEVRDGEFMTLLGQTGAGKTTLMRIMLGIDKPDSGRVYYDGEDVTDVPVQKRSVAMVYQAFINYPSLTVYENIASPLRISPQKLSNAEIDRIVRDNAALLGITEILNHRPSEISGGQQQRTAIARALTKGSKYIFLDEPLGNLDYKLREELRGELKTIFRKKEGAIVYATPDPIDALSMATNVAFVHDGRVLCSGPVGEVYDNPQFVEVGAYFSYPTMNIFEAKRVAEQGKLFLKVTGELKVNVDALKDVLADDEYFIGIRAHSISTHREKENMISVRGKVELMEVVGSDYELHLSHNGVSMISLMQRFVSYEMGQEVQAYLDAKCFFVYSKNTRRLVAKTC